MSRLAVIFVAVIALAAGGYAGYRLAHHRLMSAAAAPSPQDPAKQVLYWYDPMYPQQRFDKPGKSPFMDMQLVPKYAGDAQDPGTVAISPQVVQNLGVRLAQAKTGSIEQRFEAVGSVAYNERGVVQLQARAPGFVERLHARAPLDAVKKGEPLIEILYPEWAGAQEEYLLLKRSESAELRALADAARRRLALLGMSRTEIGALEREGRTRARMTLRSPIDGVIAELGVREGMTVGAGAALFRIVELSTVWVNAEVPEAQGARVRPGTPVRARVTAYPGEVFDGRVGAILPELNAATRTLRARVELANPGARLKPGMYATLEFAAQRGSDAVLVPSEALIRTGTRDVVILALGEGRFRAAPVEVGAESGGESEIRSGLQAGDNVVLSGQFLIDSEASVSAAVLRLEGAAAVHEGRGKVLGVDVEGGEVELEHEAMPSLRWPAMTMVFKVADKHQLRGLAPGDPVKFELRPKPDAEGNYVIERIAK